MRTLKKFGPLMVVLALLVMVSGAVGTQAWFTDTETSQDNLFEAGTLDLKVDGVDDPDVVHMTVTNLAPCDGVGGAEHSTISQMWTLSNAGTVTGQPWIQILNLDDYDNNCNEPEGLVDGTCGDPGLDEGELSSNLLLQINAAGSGGFEYPHGPECVSGRNCPLSYWVSHGPVGQGTWEEIPGGSSIAPMVFEFSLPCSVGNVVQSDSVEFDVVMHLDQVGTP